MRSTNFATNITPFSLHSSPSFSLPQGSIALGSCSVHARLAKNKLPLPIIQQSTFFLIFATIMLVILRKELQQYFSTATGYIIIALFLIATGLMLWVFPGNWNILDNGYANIDGLFTLAPWLYLFLVPAITMSLFAEEASNGTLELLYTKPLRKIEIVLGKYLAGLILILIALFPTLIWYVTVYLLGEPVGIIDSGAFWGSFIGLIFLAIAYTSIGIFSSALCKNQLAAFVLSAVLSFFCYYGFALISTLFTSGTISYIIDSIGINAHYESMSRGVLDSRDILYFLTIPAIFLTLTTELIRAKK